jgi:anti-anti-sigma regulatory factor
MATETVILDCARLSRPDIATIDRIARIRLDARRRGRDLILRNPNAATLELIALLGLERVLGVEVQRQPE